MLLYAVVAMVWYGMVWYGQVCYGLLCYWVFNFSWLWKPVCLLWLAGRLSALVGGLSGYLAVCLSLVGDSNNQPNRTIYKPFPWHDIGCDAGKQQQTTNQTKPKKKRSKTKIYLGKR